MKAILNAGDIKNDELNRLARFNLAVAYCRQCQFKLAMENASTLAKSLSADSCLSTQCSYLIAEIHLANGEFEAAEKQLGTVFEEIAKHVEDDAWSPNFYAPFVNRILIDRPKYPALQFAHIVGAPMGRDRDPLLGVDLKASKRNVVLLDWLGRVERQSGKWFASSTFKKQVGMLKELNGEQFDTSYPTLVSEINNTSMSQSIEHRNRLNRVVAIQPKGHPDALAVFCDTIRHVGGKSYDPRSRAFNDVAPLLKLASKQIADSKTDSALQQVSLLELQALASLAKNDLTAATSEFESLIDLRASHWGSDHWLTAMAQNGLGIAHYRRGDYRSALGFLRTSCQQLQLKLSNETHELTKCLNDLAVVSIELGDYKLARTCLKKATAGETNWSNPYYGIAKTNLASLRMKLGDPVDVQELKRIATSSKESPHQRVPAFLSLSTLLRQTGKPDEALSILLEAKALTPDDPVVINAIAATYRELGQLDKSRKEFETSLELLKKRNDRKAMVLTYVGLALLDRAQGRPTEGLGWLRKAWPLVQSEVNVLHPVNIDLREVFGETLLQIGDAKNAHQSLARVVTFRNHLVRDVMPTLSMAEMLRLESALQDSSAYLLASRLASISPVETYRSIFQSRASANQVLLSQAGMVYEDEARPLADEVTRLRREISKLLLDDAPRSNIRPSKQQSTRLAILTKTREAIERRLAIASKNYQRQREHRKSNLDEFLVEFPENLVLVDFSKSLKDVKELEKRFERESNYVAFVVSRTPDSDTATVQRVELPAEKTVNQAIQEWQQAIAANGAEDLNKKSRAVYDLIWEPLKRLGVDLKSVAIAPTGKLASVPWAALQDQQGKYVLESSSVVTLPYAQYAERFFQSVASDSSEPVAETKSENRLLVGGLKYDRPNGNTKSNWSYLPNTKIEVDNILEIAGSSSNTKLLTEYDADESVVLEQLRQSSLAHFSTHGFFRGGDKAQQREKDAVDLFKIDYRRRNPLALVGLVLSPVSKQGDILADQFLSGEEVTSLNLRDCKLTVLSTCESGIGYQEEENGSFGMQKAFHLAGVENVIASHWKVDDHSTMMLMTLFYENLLKKNMSKVDALREAQLWMLDNPKVVFDKDAFAKMQDRNGPYGPKLTRNRPSVDKQAKRLPPKYWAAFSISGDWK